MSYSAKDLSRILTDGKKDDLVIAETAFALVEKTAKPRTVRRRFGLMGDKIVGTEITLSGEDVKRHLNGCKEVWLIAATVGNEVDNEIKRLSASDLALAHAFDMASSLKADSLCDESEREIREEMKREGKSATPRFSCGYGDFPLSVQPKILFALDASKSAGITVSADFTMRPFKSVTAILGVCEKFEGKAFECGDCRFKSVCSHKLCAR